MMENESIKIIIFSKMTTTQITDESSVKQATIIHEYEEDEDGMPINFSEEWWRADFNYLPIHFYKKMMTKHCFELSDKNISLRRVLDIINHVVENTTIPMIQELQKEYIYTYQQQIGICPSLVMTGYIDSLKEYLSKLIRVYLDPTFYGNKIIYNHIKDTFYKFFSKERYWTDDELDDLNIIIDTLPDGVKH
jgi:hypothetical protein